MNNQENKLDNQNSLKKNNIEEKIDNQNDLMSIQNKKIEDLKLKLLRNQKKYMILNCEN